MYRLWTSALRPSQPTFTFFLKDNLEITNAALKMVSSDNYTPTFLALNVESGDQSTHHDVILGSFLSPTAMQTSLRVHLPAGSSYTLKLSGSNEVHLTGRLTPVKSRIGGAKSNTRQSAIPNELSEDVVITEEARKAYPSFMRGREEIAIYPGGPEPLRQISEEDRNKIFALDFKTKDVSKGPGATLLEGDEAIFLAILKVNGAMRYSRTNPSDPCVVRVGTIENSMEQPPDCKLLDVAIHSTLGGMKCGGERHSKWSEGNKTYHLAIQALPKPEMK